MLVHTFTVAFNTNVQRDCGLLVVTGMKVDLTLAIEGGFVLETVHRA